MRKLNVTGFAEGYARFYGQHNMCSTENSGTSSTLLNAYSATTPNAATSEIFFHGSVPSLVIYACLPVCCSCPAEYAGVSALRLICPDSFCCCMAEAAGAEDTAGNNRCCRSASRSSTCSTHPSSCLACKTDCLHEMHAAQHQLIPEGASCI